MLILNYVPASVGSGLWMLRNRRTNKLVPAACDVATVLHFLKDQASIGVDSSHAQPSRPPCRSECTRHGSGGPINRTTGHIF